MTTTLKDQAMTDQERIALLSEAMFILIAERFSKNSNSPRNDARLQVIGDRLRVDMASKGHNDHINWIITNCQDDFDHVRYQHDQG